MAAFALLPIACCIGLPLLAGVTSVAVAAWVAGSATGALALGVVLFLAARRRHRGGLVQSPISRGRS